MKLSKRLCLLALALWLPTTAWADPRDDARRHFTAGLEAAQEGEYEVALQHFFAAQDAFPHPATLFNIARAYYDLGDLPNALTYFRLFQDADPTKAGDVAPTIAAIEARLQRDQAAPTMPQTVPTLPEGELHRVGPSEEELARLQGIAAELEALGRAWRERQAEGIAMAPAEEPEPPPETEEEVEDALAELATEGFMSEAYERVVVTASRYGQEPLDSPSTVTVLTDEDIRMSGATHLPDLLRRVVGVDVMSLSAGHSDVSIRGFNRELSNKVLILIDGRSTYWDFIGTTLWGTLPITLQEVERIEVIRGPGSAVYGANAVTGVINILTKTPGEGQNQIGGSVGSPGYGNGSVFFTGREAGLGYRFSASYDQHGRWSQDFPPDAHSSPVYSVDAKDPLALQRFQGNARLDTTFLDEGYASMSAGFVRANVVEFYNIGALDNYALEDNHVYVRGDAAYGPVHLRAFWNSERAYVAPWYQLAGDPRRTASPVDADTVDVELEANTEVETGPVHHRLNGGIGYRHKRIADFIFLGQQPGDPPIIEQHYNAFLSEEATIDRLKLVATMRADVHPLLPLAQTLSPRGAIIYRVAENSSLRLNGGSSFRAPNMVESYMDFALGTGADAVFIQDYGDITLRPERILTGEIGFHDESSLFHTADVAVYVNHLTDIISLRDVEPLRMPYDPAEEGWPAGWTGWTNTDTSFTGWGLETELKLFPVDGLDVYGNFAYSEIYETSSLGTVRDTSTSAVKVNLGTMYRTPWRADVTLDVHYMSPQTWRPREFDSQGNLVVFERHIPARTLLSSRVAFRPIPDERLEVSVTAWNLAALGGNGFQEHPKGQLVGPRVHGSLTYRF